MGGRAFVALVRLLGSTDRVLVQIRSSRMLYRKWGLSCIFQIFHLPLRDGSDFENYSTLLGSVCQPTRVINVSDKFLNQYYQYNYGVSHL